MSMIGHGVATRFVARGGSALGEHQLRRELG